MGGDRKRLGAVISLVSMPGARSGSSLSGSTPARIEQPEGFALPGPQPAGHDRDPHRDVLPGHRHGRPGTERDRGKPVLLDPEGVRPAAVADRPVPGFRVQADRDRLRRHPLGRRRLQVPPGRGVLAAVDWRRRRARWHRGARSSSTAGRSATSAGSFRTRRRRRARHTARQSSRAPGLLGDGVADRRA